MSGQVCDQHSGVCVKVDNLERTTEKQGLSIKTLEEAVIKLTILVEQRTSKTSFWTEEAKKNLFRYSFIFGAIVVLALIGTNPSTLTIVKAIVGVK